MDISIIIPLYNEEESLPELFAWIQRVMAANGFSDRVTVSQHASVTFIALPSIHTSA